MSGAARHILRVMSGVALHLVMQLVWLAVLVAFVVLWVGLGLPFSMVHPLLLGLLLILGANAMVRMASRRRSDA